MWMAYHYSQGFNWLEELIYRVKLRLADNNRKIHNDVGLDSSLVAVLSKVFRNQDSFQVTALIFLGCGLYSHILR